MLSILFGRESGRSSVDSFNFAADLGREFGTEKCEQAFQNCLKTPKMLMYEWQSAIDAIIR